MNFRPFGNLTYKEKKKICPWTYEEQLEPANAGKRTLKNEGHIIFLLLKKVPINSGCWKPSRENQGRAAFNLSLILNVPRVLGSHDPLGSFKSGPVQNFSFPQVFIVCRSMVCI